MRTKEDAHDYKYFPDPDIRQVNFTDDDLARIKASLPMMPYERLEKYTGEMGIPEKDAKIIVNNKKLSDLFEEALKEYNAPKSLVNFITGDIMRRMNLGEIDIEKPMFTAQTVAKLVEMSDSEKISKGDAKEIFREMAEKGGDPETIAKREGMIIETDTGKVLEVIETVLAGNEKAVNQYKSGDTKVFGFLMGQCSKALRGVATPKVIKEELENKLKSL